MIKRMKTYDKKKPLKLWLSGLDVPNYVATKSGSHSFWDRNIKHKQCVSFHLVINFGWAEGNSYGRRCRKISGEVFAKCGACNDNSLLAVTIMKWPPKF